MRRVLLTALAVWLWALAGAAISWAGPPVSGRTPAVRSPKKAATAFPKASRTSNRPIAKAAVPTATPAATAPPAKAALSWEEWFEKRVLVTDKTEYIHAFWDAQDVRDRFAGSSLKPMTFQAAAALAASQIPVTMTADRVKFDLVFVSEKDNYGLPKWDTLERVAHLEFSRAALLKAWKGTPAPAEADLEALFTQVKYFR